MTDSGASRSRRSLAVLAAVLLALAARIPGLFWGDNFPGGFHGHHVDEWTHVVNAEVLIDPKSPPRWHPNPYPKGLAAHVAVPVLVQQKLSGRDFSVATETRARVIPPDRTLILFGRAWSVAYGALTVLVLYFLARRLTGSEVIATISAFLLALGGLHVSQSHFFVADVPTLFWTLLGTHLLLIDLDTRGGRTWTAEPRPSRRPTSPAWTAGPLPVSEVERGSRVSAAGALALPGAAFAMGVAAGLKLSIYGIPSLILVALLFPNRLLRLAQTVAFLISGAVLVNIGSFTPVDLMKTMGIGMASGVTYDAGDVLRIYGIELLASIGAPIVLLAALGLGAALRAAFSRTGTSRVFAVIVLILIPASLQALAMLRKLDPFPRHLLPFFPWLVILAAGALALFAERLRERRAILAGLFALVFGWQAALVFDGERNYITEPRNDAMRWIEATVPKGASVSWPSHEDGLRLRERKPETYFPEGHPDFVVAEMYSLNHFLSGAGPRESYPTDYRKVFDALSQPRLEAFQNLYRGNAGYTEATRFREGYFMPEFLLADRLLGNRSRNYLTELVIYRRS